MCPSKDQGRTRSTDTSDAKMTRRSAERGSNDSGGRCGNTFARGCEDDPEHALQKSPPCMNGNIYMALTPERKDPT